MQNKSNEKALVPDSLIQYSIPVYRLQYKDIVDVRIKTTIPEMNTMFGLEDPDTKQVFSQGGGQANNGDVYYQTG